MLTVTLPIPPSTNSAYATVNGRRVLSAAGRAYKHEVGWTVKAAARDWPDVLPAQRYAVTLRLWFRNNQRRDLDNTTKLLLDALTAALGFDDSRITRLVIERAGIDAARPRVEVAVEVVDGAIEASAGATGRVVAVEGTV